MSNSVSKAVSESPPLPRGPQTGGDLAHFLKVPFSELRRALPALRNPLGLANPHDLYTRTVIPKSNGKERVIDAPAENLKKIQKRIYRALRDKGEESAIYAPTRFAHGFVSDKSILTNAKEHLGQKMVIRVDLVDFFPTITFPRIRGLFMAAPYNFGNGAATALAQLCCLPHDGTMPQGAPSSPLIANLICRRMDKRLFHLAHSKTFKMRYTRYADDLTFSTSAHVDLDEFLRQVEAIIGDEGFQVNPAKTMRMPYHQRQVASGIVINEGLNVNRKYVRNLRATLYACEKSGMDNARNKAREQGWTTAENNTSFIEHLMGRIGFVRSTAEANRPNFPGKSERLAVADKLFERLELLPEYKNSRFRESRRDRRRALREINKPLRGRLKEIRSTPKDQHIAAINQAWQDWRQTDSRFLAKRQAVSPEDLIQEVFTRLRLPRIDYNATQEHLKYFSDSNHPLGGIAHYVVRPTRCEAFLKDGRADRLQKIPTSLEEAIENSLQDILKGLGSEGRAKDEEIQLSERQSTKTGRMKEAYDACTGLQKRFRRRQIRDEVENLARRTPSARLDKNFGRGLDIRCDEELFARGIHAILSSLNQHKRSDFIAIESDRQKNQCVQYIDLRDSNFAGVSGKTTDRFQWIGGDIQKAMKALEGYFELSVIANLDGQWREIFLFHHQRVEDCEPARGTTFRLRQKIFKDMV